MRWRVFHFESEDVAFCWMAQPIITDQSDPLAMFARTWLFSGTREGWHEALKCAFSGGASARAALRFGS